MSFRCGTVALIGRPNAGKSSLLNALVGEKIAAVSRRPQTTRVRIAGVYTSETMQAVLVDTPGLHDAWTPFNAHMVEEAEKALEGVDLVCWLIDAAPLVNSARGGYPALDGENIAIGEKLREHALVIALNKVDVVEKGWLLPVIEALGRFGAPIVPISATVGQGLDVLKREWASRLPEQPAIYPPDHLTDASERQICAELIRERVFELAGQEVPYATAVEIEQFDESAREQGKVRIHARILVEKPSQKGILIGKGGAMIKQIGSEARVQIAQLLGCKVRLDLFVVVEKDWTKKAGLLRGLGYA